MSNEPVAWMHIMDNTEGIKANGKGIVSITQKRKHPFGKPGVDFSKSYPITSTPLYTHPVDDTALLRQALEALEQFAGTKLVRTSNVITALRERLGEKT